MLNLITQDVSSEVLIWSDPPVRPTQSSHPDHLVEDFLIKDQRQLVILWFLEKCRQAKGVAELAVSHCQAFKLLGDTAPC